MKLPTQFWWWLCLLRYSGWFINKVIARVIRKHFETEYNESEVLVLFSGLPIYHCVIELLVYEAPQLNRRQKPIVRFVKQIKLDWIVSNKIWSWLWSFHIMALTNKVVIGKQKKFLEYARNDTENFIGIWPVLVSPWVHNWWHWYCVCWMSKQKNAAKLVK